MTQQILKLAKEITDEVPQLQRAIHRAEEGWYRFQQSGDELYLDSVALSLHNFYRGLERLFEQIARKIDISLPQGANWHQLLLQQMTTEVTNIRPAVISQDSRQTLEAYRGLRHVVRNIYAFQLDAERLKPLIENSPLLIEQISLELQSFASFLEHQS